MARPKKNAEDKKQAQQVPQVAPQPPQQPMMPQGSAPQTMAYQGMAPQMAMPQMAQPQQLARQPQHQFQQFAPQVQMPQQQPPPQMPQQPIQMPQQNVSGRVVDGESFISVRDSVSSIVSCSNSTPSLASQYLQRAQLGFLFSTCQRARAQSVGNGSSLRTSPRLNTSKPHIHFHL